MHKLEEPRKNIPEASTKSSPRSGDVITFQSLEPGVILPGSVVTGFHPELQFMQNFSHPMKVSDERPTRSIVLDGSGRGLISFRFTRPWRSATVALNGLVGARVRIYSWLSTDPQPTEFIEYTTVGSGYYPAPTNGAFVHAIALEIPPDVYLPLIIVESPE